MIYFFSAFVQCLGFSAIAVTHAEEDLKMGAEELKMGSMVDDINAYSYAYPVEYPSEKLVFKWYYYMCQTEMTESFDMVLPNDSRWYLNLYIDYEGSNQESPNVTLQLHHYLVSATLPFDSMNSGCLELGPYPFCA